MTVHPEWWGEVLEQVSAVTPIHLAVVRWEGGDDATVEWASHATAALVGVERDEAVGRRLSELYPVAYLEEILEQFRQAREHGAFAYQVVRELPAGRRTLDAVTAPLGDDRFVSFALDRTAQHEATRMLDEVTSLTGAGLFHWNVAEEDMSWTDELFRLLGYEPGEVEPSVDRYLDHVHPEDRAEPEAATAAAREQDRAIEHNRHRIVRVDGEVRTVDVRTQSVSDAAGELLYVAGIIRDVTRDIELERHAELLRRAAERQDTALVVHDQVVQSLATVVLALDLGEHDTARAEALAAVEAAQHVVADLLAEVAAVHGSVAPGALRTSSNGDSS